MSRLLRPSNIESNDDIIPAEFAKKLAVKFAKICSEEIEKISQAKFLWEGILGNISGECVPP